MKRKGLAAAIAANILWGLLPIFWKQLADIPPLLVLGNRIIWCCVTLSLMLLFQKRLPEVGKTLRDGRLMSRLVPAALFIAANWGLYIYTSNSGRIVECSLGYFINPLVVFLISALLFRERVGALELTAILVAAAGVIFSAVQYGRFPWLSLGLALAFGAYSAIKKTARIDASVAVLIETLVLLPAVFIMIAVKYTHTLASLTALQWLLLVCGGPVTALPMVLYAVGVNELPFLTLGFLQFINPVLMLFCGAVVYHEPFGMDRVVSFACIGLGLIIFSAASIRKSRSPAAPSQEG